MLFVYQKSETQNEQMRALSEALCPVQGSEMHFCPQSIQKSWTENQNRNEHAAVAPVMDSFLTTASVIATVGCLSFKTSKIEWVAEAVPVWGMEVDTHVSTCIDKCRPMSTLPTANIWH